jgi:hypothetical protein
MILNPWKENRRLREQVDLYVNMAIEDGRKAIFLQSDKEYLQEKIDGLTSMDRANVEEIHRLLDRADKLHIGLRDIIAEAKPTSNATVKRMVRMAQEALKQ